MSLTQISPGNVERYLNHKFVEATVPITVSESASQKGIENVAAEGISYYTPAQIPPSGTAIVPQPTGLPIPKLFTPLSLRKLTLPHRIILSPLCQYSAPPTGHQTSWHFAHLGGIISRGPSLTILEATAVLPSGRITPQDCGLWTDSQKEPLRNIVEFAHSQGQKIALQLNHAGRKSSTVAPWLSFAATATEDVGGWPDDVWGPSTVRHCEGYPQPKALSLEGIKEIKDAFAKAVQRALDVGFDAIEIHAAHGYLLHQFMSSVSNHRTDMYGGSFENRIRLLLEVVDATRKAMPDSMPLFLRISATDWLDKNPDFEGDSWTLSDTLRLAPILAAHGVDLLDISSSGISPLQKITTGPGYQVPFSKAIKSVLGPNSSMKVAAVGSISSGAQAEAILTGEGEGSQGEEELDLVFVGRPFLKNPSLVWSWAEELGTRVNVASQIRWPFVGRPGVGMCKEGKAGK